MLHIKRIEYIFNCHGFTYTLHSTLYTLHSTLYTLHSTLYTLHSIRLSNVHILTSTHPAVTHSFEWYYTHVLKEQNLNLKTFQKQKSELKSVQMTFKGDDLHFSLLWGRFINKDQTWTQFQHHFIIKDCASQVLQELERVEPQFLF